MDPALFLFLYTLHWSESGIVNLYRDQKKKHTHHHQGQLNRQDPFEPVLVAHFCQAEGDQQQRIFFRRESVSRVTPAVGSRSSFRTYRRR